MKNISYSFSGLLTLCLFLAACSGSTKGEIAPLAVDNKSYSVENEALTRSLKGTWNAKSVKENDILVYSKSTQKDNKIDYTKFQIELKDGAIFTLTDKDENVIEGTWEVEKGSMLSLVFEKRDDVFCSISPSCQTACGSKINYNISFVVAQKPSNGEIQLEHNKIAYFMKNAAL